MRFTTLFSGFPGRSSLDFWDGAVVSCFGIKDVCQFYTAEFNESYVLLQKQRAIGIESNPGESSERIRA